MTTIEYLFENSNCIATGVQFTINDLVFLKEHNLNKIAINEEKLTREKLTEKQIVSRLIELYKLAKVANVTSGIFVTNEEYMENMDYVFRKLEKDFSVDLEII